MIRHLLAEEGLERSDTLMIGDRKHDLIGANRNGLHGAGVGYGFGSREELLGEAPAYYFASLDELDRAFG
ncbi:5'-nucleotidase [compost metagenome]